MKVKIYKKEEGGFKGKKPLKCPMNKKWPNSWKLSLGPFLVFFFFFFLVVLMPLVSSYFPSPYLERVKMIKLVKVKDVREGLMVWV